MYAIPTPPPTHFFNGKHYRLLIKRGKTPASTNPTKILSSCGTVFDAKMSYQVSLFCAMYQKFPQGRGCSKLGAANCVQQTAYVTFRLIMLMVGQRSTTSANTIDRNSHFEDEATSWDLHKILRHQDVPRAEFIRITALGPAFLHRFVDTSSSHILTRTNRNQAL